MTAPVDDQSVQPVPSDPPVMSPATPAPAPETDVATQSTVAQSSQNEALEDDEAPREPEPTEPVVVRETVEPPLPPTTGGPPGEDPKSTEPMVPGPDPKAVGFAPIALNDGREKGDYKSRYECPQWTQIGIEAAYLLGVFAASSYFLLMVGRNILPNGTLATLLGSNSWSNGRAFILAFFGGSLGGTLFAMKWLYHSVARGLWNHDRILWRLFAPLLSAGAATTFVILSVSGVVPFFGPALAGSATGATGIGLLVGFFSDRAFSMFENMIQGLFGPPKSHEPATKSDEHK